MSNNVGIVIAALIVSAAYISGQCVTANQVPHIPAPAGASAIELFQLRSDCRDLGTKILKESPPAPATNENILAYYNENENRCYVEIQTGAASGNDATSSAFLYDGQTNEMLATYQIDANGNSTAFIFDKLAATGKPSTLGDTMSFIQSKMNGMN